MVVSTNHTILSSCKFLVTKRWFEYMNSQRLCSTKCSRHWSWPVPMLARCAWCKRFVGRAPNAPRRASDDGSIMKETEAFEKKTTFNIHYIVLVPAGLAGHCQLCESGLGSADPIQKAKARKEVGEFAASSTIGLLGTRPL